MDTSDGMAALHTNIWCEDYTYESFGTVDSCIDFWLGASQMYDVLLVQNQSSVEVLIRYNIDYTWMNDFVLSEAIVSKNTGKDILRRMNDMDIHAMYERSLTPKGSYFSGLKLPFSNKCKDYELKNQLAVTLAASKYRADHIRGFERIQHDVPVGGTNTISTDTIMGMSIPETPSLDAGIPETPSIDAGIPGSPFINAGIPGSPFINAGIPGSPFIDAGIPGSPFIDAGIPGSHESPSRKIANTCTSPIRPDIFEIADANAMNIDECAFLESLLDD
jgi:hypothetical protein